MMIVIFGILPLIDEPDCVIGLDTSTVTYEGALLGGEEHELLCRRS